ncbi:MAG: S-layer homology domain-containing protein [Oscillospiraceae bacterium]|jgi:hypothetical protein|nr:S-layer homology domain-containing protein [Oscillospiraceae bacterium]
MTTTYTKLVRKTMSVILALTMLIALLPAITPTARADEGETSRADWSTVAAPKITNVVSIGSDIRIDFNAVIGTDGADKVTVSMYNVDGVFIASVDYTAEGISGSVTFTPGSGVYKFTATAVREGETNKVSAMSEEMIFVLPLEAPYVKSATSLGGGAVEVVWDAVREATGYVLTVDGTAIKVETTELSAVAQGLTIGTNYTFRVVAIRSFETSFDAGTINARATAEAGRVWSFAAFGDGIDTTSNGYEGHAGEGAVRVYSTDGKGKLDPAARDGLAFYYTKLSAEDDNFILTATAKVNSWAYSNGQEGFGLMAADAVGTHGDSASFWNNSYMTSVTKVEYFWDSAKNAVSDSGKKITMQLGVGAQEKVGATGPETDPAGFTSTMATLDTSCANGDAGTYNIVGNYISPPGQTRTISLPFTEFKLTLQRDNTGYRLSYTDPDGYTTTKLYPDIERDNLSAIDGDNIYVGFFAARNADISFNDINLTVTSAASDAPAENLTSVTPDYRVTSAETANAVSYDLVYRGNADGTLTIKDSRNRVLVDDAEVTANTDFVQSVTLKKGSNTFTVTMTPTSGYTSNAGVVMANYDPVSFTHTVRYKTINRTYLYVAPNGSASGDGSKASPLDIYTAVKFARPGQTILLAGGAYSLSRPVVIDRGIDGTGDNPITMMPDPTAVRRPVLNFGGSCAGIVLAGDYWYLQGFDVRGSAAGQTGIQVSGSNNTLDQVDAYSNGGTGVELCRYQPSDPREKWPSSNLILNCTSLSNGYAANFADGFAARLTVGDGNVFDGCIANNNAGDGFDLSAKAEYGAIGKVVIKNSVSYRNGYLETGASVGTGDGFKLGGGSLPAGHVLQNSIAFYNKGKGISSNTCPDIVIQSSTTFDNEGANIALYTNAANSDFSATGLLSYRTELPGVKEIISPKGRQEITKHLNTSSYYWSENTNNSVNSVLNEVSADWFTSLEFDFITRNADGTINMNGFLELTGNAPGDTGARMSGNGTASHVFVLDLDTDIPYPYEDEDDDVYIPPYIPPVTPPEITTETPGGDVTTPGGKPPVTNSDGTITLPGGGTIETESGEKITLPEGTTIDPDGKITLPAEEGKVTLPGGMELPLAPGAKLKLDPDAPLGFVPAEEPFEDVAAEDWFSEDAAFVSVLGLMQGTDEGVFSPSSKVSRGMIAEILYRLVFEPETQGSGQFSDVEDGAYYADAVRWASENGIMTGYGGERFGADDTATREQCVTILYRFAAHLGLDVNAAGDLSAFADAEEISGYAETAMKWTVSVGLIRGRSATQLAPKGSLTRAEIAAILHRFVENVVDAE